jgi:hypothetical protein
MKHFREWFEWLEPRTLLCGYTIRAFDPVADAEWGGDEKVVPPDLVEGPWIIDQLRLFAVDSNAAGLVVGQTTQYPSFKEFMRPFIWDGRAMYHLDRLIADPHGWDPVRAIGINEQGEILGQGWHGPGNAGLLTFVLTPIPDAGSHLPPPGETCPAKQTGDDDDTDRSVPDDEVESKDENEDDTDGSVPDDEVDEAHEEDAPTDPGTADEESPAPSDEVASPTGPSWWSDEESLLEGIAEPDDEEDPVWEVGRSDLLEHDESAIL